MSRVLVTGAAGFIGFHLSRRLLERGDQVVGVDNLNSYYDVSLKEARLSRLEQRAEFDFRKLDVGDRSAVANLFRRERFNRVVHLAAQAGVRYSLENPAAYIDSNLVGFGNILEGCRRQASLEHLVFASSSSVYGSNSKLPFSVGDNVDHPISLYAATKKANELMAHAYSHLYGLSATGLRFFTVYGPWGRPDMALFKFVRAILNDEPIDVYNHGRMVRDFTYIDDIVEGVVRVLDRAAEASPEWRAVDPDPASSNAPYRLYNIGNNRPVDLRTFIRNIEEALGKKAKIRGLPMQPGDVKATQADVSHLARDFDYSPSTPVKEGIRRFVEWYCRFYRVRKPLVEAVEEKPS